jgi:hypothetical protein
MDCLLSHTHNRMVSMCAVVEGNRSVPMKTDTQAERETGKTVRLTRGNLRCRKTQGFPELTKDHCHGIKHSKHGAYYCESRSVSSGQLVSYVTKGE